MSPALSINSSKSCSNSSAKVKIEAMEVEEPRGHHEDASTGPGGSTSMVEIKKCWVQLQRVQVVLKTNEQVQMSTGQMEDDRSKTYEAPGELGLKMAKKRPTELP